MGVIDAAFEFVSSVVKVRARRVTLVAEDDRLRALNLVHLWFRVGRVTMLKWTLSLHMCLQMGDGSYLSIQTDKPMYYAGETVTGKVIVFVHRSLPRYPCIAACSEPYIAACSEPYIAACSEPYIASC